MMFCHVIYQDTGTVNTHKGSRPRRSSSYLAASTSLRKSVFFCFVLAKSPVVVSVHLQESQEVHSFWAKLCETKMWHTLDFELFANFYLRPVRVTIEMIESYRVL